MTTHTTIKVTKELIPILNNLKPDKRDSKESVIRGLLSIIDGFNKVFTDLTTKEEFSKALTYCQNQFEKHMSEDDLKLYDKLNEDE